MLSHAGRAVVITFIMLLVRLDESVLALSNSVIDDQAEVGNVLPELCASDPIYQTFEKIQQQAYLDDKELHFGFLLDRKFQSKLLQDLRSRLPIDTGEVNGILGIDKRSYAQQIRDFENLELPTCYESPLFYYRISVLVRDIEQARLALHKRLDGSPRFGSIPSNEINAYTYVSSDGRSGVIAMNVELFDFIHGMASIAASVVDPDITKNMTQSDFITHALLAISYNMQAKREFVNLIAALLEGKPLHRIMLNPSKQVLALVLAGAMERFVVGHEYGHLINNDFSTSTKLPVGATGIDQYDVLNRTWPQEFEADAAGLELLIESLTKTAADSPRDEAYFTYALRAPLFFFDCEAILEGARYMKETGAMPNEMSVDGKAFIRECVANPGSVPSCSRVLQETHPPAWLRRERLENRVTEAINERSRGPSAQTASDKAKQMSMSVRLLWEESARLLLAQLRQDGEF
jgi:hypothetical protein